MAGGRRLTRSADFRAALAAAGRVHVDAPVLATHLLGRERLSALTGELFEGLRAGEFEARTSAITLYQVLAEPYRRGRDDLAAEAHRVLAAVSGLEVVPVTGAVANRAAQVRARLGGSPERALQIATALEGGAAMFLTDRSALRRVAGTVVVTLETYAAGAAASAAAG